MYEYLLLREKVKSNPGRLSKIINFFLSECFDLQRHPNAGIGCSANYLPDITEIPDMKNMKNKAVELFSVLNYQKQLPYFSRR